MTRIIVSKKVRPRRLNLATLKVPEDLPEEAKKVPLADLRVSVYKATGTWPDRTKTKAQHHQMLWNKLPVTTGLAGIMRSTLEAHIEENKMNLSLHCHGRCREHPDEMVVACYLEFLADSAHDLYAGLEDLLTWRPERSQNQSR